MQLVPLKMEQIIVLFNKLWKFQSKLDYSIEVKTNKF